MDKFRRLLLIVLLGNILGAMWTQCVWANNLRISNVSLEERNQSANTAVVEFDISWDNSWRDEVNHDAAWVVLKVRVASNAHSNHGPLYAEGLNPNGTSPGSNKDLDIYVTNDNVGAFIRRRSAGTGTVSSQNVRLVLDYGNILGGTASNVTAIVVRVIGIEMVYVPTGPFYAGDVTDASTSAPFTTYSSNVAWYISSDGQLVTVSSGAGYFYSKPVTTAGNAYNTADEFTVPALYPLGYTGFYCMKYELTEGQYVDFLNMIPDTAAGPRNPTTTGSGGKNLQSVVFRNTISGLTSGTFASYRPDRAANYISYVDLAAYLDWVGLRPMTELEFEKTARGPIAQDTTQITYAWGNSQLQPAQFFSTSPESGMESITGNAVYGPVTFSGGDTILYTGHNRGPTRVGIFATGSSGRTEAGAGFYGAMELSGNVTEYAVTIGSVDALSFGGTHGDGEITSTGFANVTNWPLLNLSFVTTGSGVGRRGGHWGDVSIYLKISDRYEAVWPDNTRWNYYGGRGVRTSDSADSL